MGTPPIAPPQAPLVLQTPAPIHVAKYARNRLAPHAVFESDVAAALNFVGAVRTKNLFTYACPLASIPSSTYSARVRWRFAAHTGPLLRKIRATVYLARQNGGDPIGVAPSATLYITNADGSITYGTGTFAAGANYDGGGGVNDTPDEFAWGEIEIDGVPVNSDIYGRFEDGGGGGRLIAATVYEESLPLLASNGYVAPSQVSVTAPIYDQRRQDLYTLATKLWKWAAAPLWNWTVDNQASPLTTNSATARNIVDNTSTTVSASTPGATLDLRYCRTLGLATVPCVLKAYGSFSAGTGGAVAILDSGGSVLGQIFNGWTSATPAWASAAINLPANLDKLALHFSAGSGFGTFSLGAVSLAQYAA